MSVNSITVKGNVGRVEIVNEGSDKEFRSLSVCCSEYMGKNESGEARYQDTWFDVVAFGGQGTRVGAAGIKTGDYIEVSGRMTKRENEKDGVKYENWSIMLNDFEMLRRKPEA